MRLVIQRVKQASVSVDDNSVGAIEKGLLVFLGIHKDDKKDVIEYLIRKLLALRIFSDDECHMNKSVQDVSGKILIVSQFTLYANCTKGNRPSFDNAMSPANAEEFYNEFVKKLNEAYPTNIETGVFGAYMKVQLVNDGPVTIILDSRL